MSVQDVSTPKKRPFAGLAFALGVVVRAAPELVAVDALINLAEALAPLAMLQGTRLLLDALGAGRPPWPGLALLAVGEAVPAFGSRVAFGPVGEAMTRRIQSVLRPRVLSALATMPWVRLEGPAARDRLDRVEDGIAAVDIAWDSGGALVRDIGRGLSALGFLLTVSPWAALFAAAALVPEVLLRRVAAVEWEGVRLSQIPAQREAGYLFGLLTGPASAAEVRLFRYAGYIRERWLAALRRVQRAELAEQARTAWRAQLAGLAGTALMAAAAALVLLRHGEQARWPTACWRWSPPSARPRTSAIGWAASPRKAMPRPVSGRSWAGDGTWPHGGGRSACAGSRACGCGRRLPAQGRWRHCAA